MDLINTSCATLLERIHCYNAYAAQNTALSSHRADAFEGFIKIHLVLLPAHAAVVTKFPGTGNIYSYLVAVLGITICIVSYNRIKSIFTRIEAGFDELCEIESAPDFPYRYYTNQRQSMRAKEGRIGRLKKYELVFHWVVGFMYASMPFIPSVERLLESLGGR